MFKLAMQLNLVQAGQLNHVQVCQQAKTSCAFLRVYRGSPHRGGSSPYNSLAKVCSVWVPSSLLL